MSIKKLINELSIECVDIAIDLKLIKRPATFKRKLNVKVTKIRGCWGGLDHKQRPQISFGLLHTDVRGTNTFVEYKHIHKHKVIGGFESENHLHARMAVVAHELAHAIDHWNEDSGWGAHKDTWRFIYGQIRRTWVNPLLN